MCCRHHLFDAGSQFLVVNIYIDFISLYTKRTNKWFDVFCREVNLTSSMFIRVY